jgi:hypothetical protein
VGSVLNKKCVELRGECVEQLPSFFAVVVLLPGRAKDLSAHPHIYIHNLLLIVFLLIPTFHINFWQSPISESPISDSLQFQSPISDSLQFQSPISDSLQFLTVSNFWHSPISLSPTTILYEKQNCWYFQHLVFFHKCTRYTILLSAMYRSNITVSHVP